MSKTIEDLRETLFNTLDRLNDKDDPMDTDRAKSVCEVASVIIETAKAEVSFMRVAGVMVQTKFITAGAGPGPAQDGKLPSNVR